MNKKLMALAVAGALAAPAVAFAQASNVQIYGRANLGLDNYQATGATTSPNGDLKSRNRIYDAGSRIGFRGTEDLGNGLRAIFLMESGVNIDNGLTTAQHGAVNVNTGTLSSRIGYVGLQSSWGTLTFGRNNVWWVNWGVEQTQGNYVNLGMPHIGGIFGRGMNTGLTSRVSNLLQYTSPTWSGFNAILSYSPNSEAVQASASPAGQSPTDGRIYGITINGAFGPIAGGYDWVNNKASSPAPGTAAFAAGNAQGETIGNKFRIGWTYQPGGQISLIWVGTKLNNIGGPEAYSVAAGTGASLKQTGWGLNWEHVFGNIQALAQWGKINNVSGCAVAANCANTNATTWMLGARYLLSKRTAAYVTYNQINNDSNYNVDYIGGGITSAVPGTLAVGADPRVWAVGIIHNF